MRADVAGAPPLQVHERWVGVRGVGALVRLAAAQGQVGPAPPGPAARSRMPGAQRASGCKRGRRRACRCRHALALTRDGGGGSPKTGSGSRSGSKAVSYGD
eukprot:3463898-Rhodomonas_salina.1